MLSSTFGPQTLQLADPLRLGGGPEVVQGGDLQLVEEPPRRLRPKPWHPRDGDQSRRELLLQLHGGGDLAGVEQGDDLLLQGLADPRQLGGAASARQLLN